MSIFQLTELPCPVCKTLVAFDLVVSVNADRRPDLRQEILDGKFQRKVCPACSSAFRVDPEFTYIDLARGQYIGVWPVAKRTRWQSCAELSLASFDLAYGKKASPEAIAIAGGMEPRAVFGWPALIEKLIAKAAGIDDRTLEMAKVAAVHSLEASPLPGSRELRLVDMIDRDPIIGWVRSEDEQVTDRLRLPRSLISDIESAPATWRELSDDVAEGIVVDFQREMLTS